MSRLLGWARRLAVVAVALVLLAPPAVADHPPSVGPNVPATASNLQVRPINNSPMLAEDPTEARFVALANRIDGPQFSCALQVSGDGGAGWVPADPVPTLPPGAERCYGPEVAFDAEGTLYYLFVGLAGQGNEPMGVFLTTSTDRARSFSVPQQVLGPGNYQVRMAIDPDAGERGRIHLVWLQVREATPVGGLPSNTANPIVAAHSDDGGKTFSAPVQLSDPARVRVVAPALALGPGRALHVAYYDLGDDVRDYQGLEGPTWEGNWSVLATRSGDGGRSFEPSVVIDDAVVPPGRVMLIFTMAPPSLAVDGERVYAAWGDGRRGDPDVFFSRSGDGGRSWAEAGRLNDDPVGNGAHQYLPRLSVAPGGRLDAIFYDRRGDPTNVLTDVSYTFSDDDGRSFSADRKLTTIPSNSRFGTSYPIPSARGLIEHGSRLAVLSRPASVVAAWADIRNQRSGDIFTTTVSLPRHRSSAARWVLPAAVAGLGALAVIAVVARRRGQAGRAAVVGAGDGEPNRPKR